MSDEGLPPHPPPGEPEPDESVWPTPDPPDPGQDRAGGPAGARWSEVETATAEPVTPAAGPGDERRGAERTARRRRRVVLLVVGAVVAVVVVLGAWYEIEANPLGGPGNPVVVEVAKGEPVGDVAGTLASRGVIASSLAFRISLLIHGTPSLAPGGYLFHQNQSFSTVRQIMSAGPDVFAVDVYPGYTLREVSTAVGTVPGHDAATFTKAAQSGAVTSPWQPTGSVNLEGLLGSGTYQVLPGESDHTLLGLMVARFNHQAVAAGLTPSSAAALGLTPYQVIIAASVVQKEGYIVKNMGPVARVIDNRLARGTPLQMDSTILYSLGQDGGTVTKADLALDTPYNTYKHTGLPPTPICIPSPAALRATVSPPPGSWLYFTLVAKDGTLAFSDTFAQQLANEKLAQSRGVP